jgi:hypothetical protein
VQKTTGLRLLDTACIADIYICDIISIFRYMAQLHIYAYSTGYRPLTSLMPDFERLGSGFICQ